MGLSELEILKTNAYHSSLTGNWIGLFIGLVLLGFALLFLLQDQIKIGCTTGVAIAVASLLCGGLFWVPTGASADATYAATTGVDAAKKELIDSREMLFGYWTAYSDVEHECQHSSISAAGTNCTFVHKVVTTVYDGEDSKGRKQYHDEYDWYPRFYKEHAATAHLGVYEGGDVDFGSYASSDPSNLWTGIFGQAYESDVTVILDTDDTIQDFFKIKAAVDSGQLLAGAVPHQYDNYFNGNPASLQIKDSGLPTPDIIDGYVQAGLLAGMTPLTRNYSINFSPVNFVGTLAGAVPAADQQSWEEKARMTAGDVGPHLEGYMFITFASKQDLGTRTMHEWAGAQKAYLMNQSLFDKWRIPKNTIGLVCAVDYPNKVIDGCYFFQGMFTGNGVVEQDVASTTNIAFNPEAFFGSVSGSLVTDTDGSVKAESSHSGGFFDVLYNPERGFKRQHMGEQDYLYATIEITDAQKQAIINQAGTKGFWHGVSPLGVIAIMIGALAFMRYQSSSSY